MRKFSATALFLAFIMAGSGFAGAQELPFPEEDNSNPQISIDCIVLQEQEIALCIFPLQELQQQVEEEDNSQDEVMESIREFLDEYLENQEDNENTNNNENNENTNNSGNENDTDEPERPPWYSD